MANLILTTKCQRRCAYCFAQEDRTTDMEFTLDNFKKAVEFIGTSHKAANLLGGEPTLHKDIVEMLRYLIVNDFLIQVFTNGMVSDELIDSIKNLISTSTLRDEQLSFGVNVNELKYRSEGETELQEKFFKSLGNYAYLSFTIQDADVDLTFLHDTINNFGLQPNIRLGMALPIFGTRSNKYIPLEEYKTVAKSIIHLSNNSPGTKIIFDCGFPLCMFTMEEINLLNMDDDNMFSFMCGQPIDIYPDLNVINCYPLIHVYKASIHDFKNLEELRRHLHERLATPHGIYEEKCTECSFFRRVCFGGCRGFFRPDLSNGGDA